MSTKTPVQKILKGILHTKLKKTNITTKEWTVLNLMGRTNKYTESSTELATILKSLNNNNK
jgi:hypothetical protein